ncbi:hypothetical protein BuS5_00766 [Desulfosarcina sp. BuS5]|uniref:type II toxin-antitoxin system VapC family toxin n=1 Tax=Desulfosarcina sp. BuS5 TaxID=933262 RepID=UPI000483A373|nr:type II toxin-antitoxin system VapC family toxin [Desulfosarcina sp. BuS5]WDN87798.1 hypothetical protein BuS5_00766 [Desulfosarcina sp. BuS5]
MAKSIVIDTGFWFALFDDRDRYHEDALLYFEYIAPHTLLIPWPTLYETLNTRFSRRQSWTEKFHRIIKSHSTYYISDKDYKEVSLNYFFSHGQRFSLVDIIIRNILEDDSVKIDAILTFNESDFIDICYKKGIELFNG